MSLAALLAFDRSAKYANPLDYPRHNSHGSWAFPSGRFKSGSRDGARPPEQPARCYCWPAGIPKYFSMSREGAMASVKKGNRAAPPQWWKHLRDWKRVFWKKERRAQVREIKRDMQ